MAVRTLEPHLPNSPCTPMRATGAAEAFRPPQPNEVISAGSIGRKTLLQLKQVARVIGVHTSRRYREREPASSRYPFGQNP
jgi:hypothetical protein